MSDRPRPFRFGVLLVSADSRAAWMTKCRQAEQLGYDVVNVPDHLGMIAPLPCLLLAAEATERARIGTFVLNTAFQNPVALARDVTAINRFSGGRVELGLGAGYVKAEFETAGVPFGRVSSRVDRLEKTVLTLREYCETNQVDCPRLLLGGHGDRLLRLAAQQADVVGFLGAEPGAQPGRMRIVSRSVFDERVEFARTEAKARTDEVEFNVLSKATVLTNDRHAAAADLRHYNPDLTPAQLLEVPTLFVGTPAEIADQLRTYRDELGLTYFTVLEPAMTDFAKVIEELR
ncbi:TIGR03621 family F420-dependent LLM class oxidoreductase [Kutzneria viridogrisea]|uniref:F420-dependent oxidoreductase n=1 Tax=Kutzneria viridogrisea TaxID=47990 RepID=A0ABR6BAI0_9PSEU|nr:putative F420-dependent oxidoreductase [Kutzneria viridogrisea]